MTWIEWYDSLAKPSWTPAPATISLIWTVLYPVILVSFGSVFVQAFRRTVPWQVRHTHCRSVCWDTFQGIELMASDFKRGDHVEWNSEAGLVRGTIQKKVTSEITFKGYKRHASEEEPQYVIKSDTTDHIAIHKGSALKKIKRSKKSKG